MALADFNGIDNIKDDDKTVLDAILHAKFKSAINGNSRDTDFLFNQAFGEAPKYKEAQSMRYRTIEEKRNEVFSLLTREDIEKLLIKRSKD